MSNSYTTTVPVIMSVGDNELHLRAKIRFTYVPAEKETGPTYSCGGTPGSPEGVEDVEVVELAKVTEIQGVTGTVDEIERADAPKWLLDWIVENVDHDELLEAVPEGPDPDDERDRMQDDE